MQGFPRGDAFEIRNDRQAVARTLPAVYIRPLWILARECHSMNTRVMLLCAGLTNDVKAITGHIEERLHALHAAARAKT